jgi:hypothetical protein
LPRCAPPVSTSFRVSGACPRPREPGALSPYARTLEVVFRDSAVRLPRLHPSPRLRPPYPGSPSVTFFPVSVQRRPRFIDLLYCL